MADSVSFKDSAKKVLLNKGIDGGQANAVNFIILPKGTTDELAELPNKEGGIAYDTTQQSLVINSGSGYAPVSGSGAVDSVNGQTGIVVLSADDVDAASQQLDNLSNTAINADLLPDSDDSYNLGSDTLKWSEVYVAGTVRASAFQAKNQGTITLYDSDNSNFLNLKAPSTISTNFQLFLPNADGSSGQVLSTDGSGNLDWISPGTTFPLLAPNGDPTAPSYAFVGSPDTGLYASGTSIGIVSDSNFIVGFHSSGDPRISPAAPDTIDIGTLVEYFKNLYIKNAHIRYGELRFYDSDLSNYVSIYPDATIPSNYALKLPASQGAAGTVLQNDGTGILSFSSMAMQMYSASSDPGSPVAGQVYYNSTSNKLKFYNGSAWETITSAVI